MNIRYLLSFILLFTATFDTTLFAAKRSFDKVDASEHSSDDDFCDDDKQEDYKDSKSKSSPKSTKGRIYPCNLCPKKFSARSSCARHKKIHSGVTYQCQHCEKTFADTRRYTRHEQTVHSGIKYPCQYCKKEYAQSDNRNQHQKKCTQNPALSQAGPALPLHAVEPALAHESDTVVAPASKPSLLSSVATAPAANFLSLTPQEFALDQEMLDSIDFLFPTSTDEIQAFLQHPLPTPLTDSYLLPPYQPSLDPDSLFSASSIQAGPTQEADPTPLPNIYTDDIEHYLQDNS